MKAPFSALIKSLQSVFHLEVMRNGKYIYPAVQLLREAMEHYNPNATNTFLSLQKAIIDAMPYIRKRHVSLDVIKTAMDALAAIHQTQSIDWTRVKTHTQASSRFQFGSHHATKDTDLITWITSRTGKSFFQLEPNEVTQALIDNKNKLGFSQKLSSYLKKNPDFLFHLIMDSEKNFIKICHSRLILYLTDQQIAKSIIKHIASFVHKKAQPFEQVEQLVHTLNDILSNGRSISTLLRNAEAKPILFNSIFFQLYQSEGYAKHQERVRLPQEELLGEVMKPY
ncbi:hypothetical protein [Legionella fallonii]|uniref:Uncharacterized protein n=1 Tax=Legionella fallonii LLAP-10 TaxID=1212491 RepID=A0A098G802_9GAMM|nr:hypothetical protein [Legionella fallonii]CEG58587.1 conserved protein of unknown function [Legionella fallonii LLAP-10]